jgi:hypothetical protein
MLAYKVLKKMAYAKKQFPVLKYRFSRYIFLIKHAIKYIFFLLKICMRTYNVRMYTHNFYCFFILKFI